LYSCAELSKRIIALSTNGEVSIVDADSLDVKGSRDAQTGNVIFAKFLPTKTTMFSSKSNGAVLALVESGSSKSTYLRILAIDEADSILEQETEIPVESQVSQKNIALLI